MKINRKIEKKGRLLQAHTLVKGKKGTTLVETMVTLFLISIMMAMAASALSAASRIFVRIQKEQYAQSILDTMMTELRTITKDATGYVKLYSLTTVSDDSFGGAKGISGSSLGYALEFLTKEGYAEMVSANGAPETEIRIGDNAAGTADAISRGQLLTRYYFRNSSNGKYTYKENGKPVARAMAAAFGKGFYMGNYVQVEYKLPSGAENGSKINNIIAKVTVYTDYDPNSLPNYKNAIASDTEILEFRNPLTVKAGEGSETATNK